LKEKNADVAEFMKIEEGGLKKNTIEGTIITKWKATKTINKNDGKKKIGRRVRALLGGKGSPGKRGCGIIK